MIDARAEGVAGNGSAAGEGARWRAAGSVQGAGVKVTYHIVDVVQLAAEN